MPVSAASSRTAAVPSALLALYRDGTVEATAFADVLHVDRAEFMKRFEKFAEADLRSWGMLAEPSMAMMVEEVRAETGAAEGAVEIDAARLDALLAKHPAHPDLLELWLRRRLKGDAAPDALALQQLAAYSALRPIDPWPHRVLAKAALAAGDPAAAVPHLQVLDSRDPKMFIRRSGEPFMSNDGQFHGTCKRSKSPTII